MVLYGDDVSLRAHLFIVSTVIFEGTFSYFSYFELCGLVCDLRLTLSPLPGVALRSRAIVIGGSRARRSFTIRIVTLRVDPAQGGWCPP